MGSGNTILSIIPTRFHNPSLAVISRAIERKLRVSLCPDLRFILISRTDMVSAGFLFSYLKHDVSNPDISALRCWSSSFPFRNDKIELHTFIAFPLLFPERLTITMYVRCPLLPRLECFVHQRWRASITCTIFLIVTAFRATRSPASTTSEPRMMQRDAQVD